MTCYIVGAGDFFGEISPNPDDIVIAADGGYDTLKRIGVKPNLLIGDMDSILTDQADGIEKILHPVEKDETDSYLAYLEGVKRGYRHFRLYGGVGGRPDHTFANYSLLLGAKLDGCEMTLVDKNYEIFVIKDENVTLSSSEGLSLSVFAFGGDAHGVSISGAKYSADDITLKESFPLGVSNSFGEQEVHLGVKNGALLVMMQIS